MKFVTIHGIGRQSPDFSAGLERNLLGTGLRFDPRPVWWQPSSPLPESAPLFMDWFMDLWLSWSWLYRRRREGIFQMIREAVGGGAAVVVAHSHGVWLSIQALRLQPPVDLFISLDRAVHRFGGVHFPGHHEVRFKKWINVYSTILGARVPVEHFSDVCPDIRNVAIHSDDLPHGDYWASARVAEIVAFHWPREMAA